MRRLVNSEAKYQLIIQEVRDNHYPVKDGRGITEQERYRMTEEWKTDYPRWPGFRIGKDVA